MAQTQPLASPTSDTLGIDESIDVDLSELDEDQSIDVDLSTLEPDSTPYTHANILTLRALRAQAIRYELKANDGRYCSPVEKVAIRNQAEMVPHPLCWLTIPVQSDQQASVFFPRGSRDGARLQSQLIRDLPGPDGTPRKVALLPLHWEEAKTLKKRFPSVEIIEDGRVFRGASPRSLFVGPDEASAPKVVPNIEGYSLKMHLSIDTYNRLGGLGGNRDIDFKDAKIASMFSHVMKELSPKLSRRVQWQAEDITMAVKLQKSGDEQEIGMIFRQLGTEPAIPGFALYSPTSEPLPHLATGSATLAVRNPKQRILAGEAIDFYCKRNPERSRRDGYIDLFVDPLLDVIMSLAAQGMSMELHSQNFLLAFEPKTGAVKHVIVRDLHGLNYDAAWRQKHGMNDLFSVEHLRAAFPSVSQKDLDAWFKRDGQVRERYLMPGAWQSSLDFFTSMFWLNTLDSLLKHKYFDKSDINHLVERIKGRVDRIAELWSVDLGTMTQPQGSEHSFWVAEKKGIRGRVLFRRPR